MQMTLYRWLHPGKHCNKHLINSASHRRWYWFTMCAAATAWQLTQNVGKNCSHQLPNFTIKNELLKFVQEFKDVGHMPNDNQSRYLSFELCTSKCSSCHHLTTSIVLSSNKIQNGDILVPANPGPPGRWPLKRRGTYLSWKEFFFVVCGLRSAPVVCFSSRLFSNFYLFSV